MKFLKIFLAALLAVIAGGAISIILFFMVIMGMASMSMQETTVVAPDSVLEIDLATEITDKPVSNPMDLFDFSTMDVRESASLYSVLCAIDAAKSDDRIKGIYIHPAGAGMVDDTTLEELRDAIEEFKAESGKFVVAYSEAYSQDEYYFASAADRIYIQPEGGMAWQGVSYTLNFFKGALDKLGVEFEIFRPTACKYKSAVEPFFMTKMSDANREQMKALAETTWRVFTEAVSESRGISIEKLNELADNLSITLPEEALEHGFVDGILYEDQMNDLLAEEGVGKDRNGNLNIVSLTEYAAQTGTFRVSKNKVGIIYAEGQIYDGSGDRDIYSHTLAQQISEARNDKSIKAVVLRVNSPGGSALASDVIWREIELLKAEKPVIVSMGSAAASGGYFISAPADVIITDRMTHTGSIGVFGMIPNANKLLTNKIGITFDGVGTNKHSEQNFLTNPISPAERAMIMRSVDRVYETFTGVVSKGRNLPIERVLDIAGGRVWTGEDAVEIGLADACGGLKTAIAVAIDKAALGDDFAIKELVPAPEGLLGMLTQSMNSSVRERFMRAELGSFYNSYMTAKRVAEMRGAMAICPYEISIVK